MPHTLEQVFGQALAPGMQSFYPATRAHSTLESGGQQPNEGKPGLLHPEGQAGNTETHRKSKAAASPVWSCWQAEQGW